MYRHPKAEPLRDPSNSTRKEANRERAKLKTATTGGETSNAISGQSWEPETSRGEPLKHAFNNGKIDKRTAGCGYTQRGMYMSRARVDFESLY